MDSHFRDRYENISPLIQKPEEANYIFHTSIGMMIVRKFIYRDEAGYIFLEGCDESGRDRIVGFSEQQLSTFPFEIQIKSADKNGQVRFNPSFSESFA